MVSSEGLLVSRVEGRGKPLTRHHKPPNPTRSSVGRELMASKGRRRMVSRGRGLMVSSVGVGGLWCRVRGFWVPGCGHQAPP